MADEEKGLKDRLTDFLLEAASFGLKARNEADKEEKEKKAGNEDVDKRQEMGDIGGFLKSKGLSDEDIRHVYKIMEKLSYDKSSTGAADNAKNKAKNEEDGADDDAKEKEAKNKCKNEDGKSEEEYKEFKEKIDETAENKKASNSIDDIKNAFYSGGKEEVKSLYITQEERIERGMKY